MSLGIKLAYHISLAYHWPIISLFIVCFGTAFGRQHSEKDKKKIVRQLLFLRNHSFLLVSKQLMNKERDIIRFDHLACLRYSINK